MPLPQEPAQGFFLLVVCCQVKRPRERDPSTDGRNADAFSIFFLCLSQVFVELRSSPLPQVFFFFVFRHPLRD
jgi:hypothetical protein